MEFQGRPVESVTVTVQLHGRDSLAECSNPAAAPPVIQVCRDKVTESICVGAGDAPVHDWHRLLTAHLP